MPVLQTGDPGAIPGESTLEGMLRERSRGPAATTSGLQPENDGSSPSGTNEDFGIGISDFGYDERLDPQKCQNPKS